MGDVMPIVCTVYDQNKNSVGSIDLTEKVFSVPLRDPVLHQVITGYLKNERSGTSAVKTKGLVSGGGKKPWRQKGTGRARVGSIRSPLWKGGGTIFGPVPKDYYSQIPKKMRREALKIALSSRAKEGKIVVIDDMKLPEGKTKSFVALTKTMGWNGALVVGEKIDGMTKRAVRNVPGYRVMEWKDLNAYDVLKFPTLVFTSTALKHLSENLS